MQLSNFYAGLLLVLKSTITVLHKELAVHKEFSETKGTEEKIEKHDWLHQI